MGNARSTKSEFETTDRHFYQTDKEVRAIFNSPKNNIDLDSTDSEITIDDSEDVYVVEKKGTDTVESANPLLYSNPSNHSKTSRKLPEVINIESENNPSKQNSLYCCNPSCKCCTNSVIDSCVHCYSKVDNSSSETYSEDIAEDTTYSEGMHDYHCYSREPPEKDLDIRAGCRNMKNCYHHCDEVSRNCSLCGGFRAYENQQKSINKFNSRPISDSYVSCKGDAKNQNSLVSKSAPINVQKFNYVPPSAAAVTVNNLTASGNPLATINAASPSTKVQKSRSVVKPKSSNHHSVLDRKSSPEQIEGSSSDNSKQMYSHYSYSNNNNKQHKYPYEEPPDTTSYTHDTCYSQNCNGYCKCQCLCDSDQCYQRNLSDDQVSCGSGSTKTDFMNLAYQHNGDYPELVDELENTLSARNKLRVQKTMQQFEMLSRQNKNLDKPIFDDEESLHNYRRYRNRRGCRGECCRCSCCKQHHHQQQQQSQQQEHQQQQQQQQQHNDSTESRSTNYKSNTNTYKSRSESLSKRSSSQQPMYQKQNAGYVEKVARYMDTNYNKQKGSSVGHHKNNNQNGNGNGSGSWQMDQRKGEWVKVNPDNQYDFENNYPPLPPRPHSSHVYDDRNSRGRHEYCGRVNQMEQRQCGCNKCRRNR